MWILKKNPKMMMMRVSAGMLLAVVFHWRRHRVGRKIKAPECLWTEQRPQFPSWWGFVRGFARPPQQYESVPDASLPLRRTSFSLFSRCFSSFSWALRSSFSFFLTVERSLWLETPSAWGTRRAKLTREEVDEANWRESSKAWYASSSFSIIRKNTKLAEL